MKRLIHVLLAALVLCWVPLAPAAAQQIQAQIVSQCGTNNQTPPTGSFSWFTMLANGRGCFDFTGLSASITGPIPAGPNTIGGTVPTPLATAGMSTSSAIVANNTTSVAIDASPGTLYALRVFNNSATIAYLKLYNAAQGSTTCGSGTPVMRVMIPASTSGAGATINVGGGLGVAFSTAISRCVTTGIADNDTGAPAASTYVVEADYK